MATTWLARCDLARAIQQLSDTIHERVVLLRYEKTHDYESSCVALFDGDGTFVAYYELHSEQFYETYVNKDVLAPSRHV